MAMAFQQGMSQTLHQRQEMALTQAMLQSMEILQLQQMDLDRRLADEMSQNPALECAEFADDPDAPDAPEPDPDIDARYDAAPGAHADDMGDDGRVEADRPPAAEDFDPAPYAEHGEAGAVDEPFARIDAIDDNAAFESWHDDDEYGPRRERGAPGSGGGDDDERFDPVVHLAARGPSFPEHLDAQLADLALPPRQRRLARAVIAHLDADGWLRAPLEPLALAPDEDPPATPAELADALATVQRLDPAGVGARDVRECLALQLDRRAAEDPSFDPDRTARRIVRDELDNLAANRLPLIARRLDVDLEAVKKAVLSIRACRPDPAAGFESAPAVAVRPDVRIVFADADPQTGTADGAEADGKRLVARLPGAGSPAAVSDFWMALFERTPRARILRERFLADPDQAPAFRAMRDKLRADPEAARRYRALYDGANGLMKAVAMRGQTLLRVTEAIIDAQEAYLCGDAEAPAPLSMQDVARRVGYDESTISRAVKDKFADTPRGILPLRGFFVRGATGVEPAPASADAAPADGGALSAQHVINRLRALLDGEDKHKPLRDNELLDLLAKEGFHLARRTVANYRAQLGVPSHSRRRAY